MNKTMFRREFLVAAGGAAVAAPTIGAFARPSTPGASPTGSEARLFVGCCALSYLKYFNAGSMTMESFIRKAVELQVHGVDITTYWLMSTEPGYLNFFAAPGIQEWRGFFWYSHSYRDVPGRRSNPR